MHVIFRLVQVQNYCVHMESYHPSSGKNVRSGSGFSQLGGLESIF